MITTDSICNKPTASENNSFVSRHGICRTTPMLEGLSLEQSRMIIIQTANYMNIRDSVSDCFWKSLSQPCNATPKNLHQSVTRTQYFLLRKEIRAVETCCHLYTSRFTWKVQRCLHMAIRDLVTLVSVNMLLDSFSSEASPCWSNYAYHSIVVSTAP